MYVIIGASSFIGRHLYNYCKKNKLEVFGTYHTHPFNDEWVKFDMCKNDLKEICHEYLDDIIPEAVVICGANTSIDSCKRDEEASNRLNIQGIKRILNQTDEMGSKSVFLSSEAVFDGIKGMYSEDDVPNPINLYGRQKLQIEEYMVHNLKNYLIFRMSRAVGCSFGEQDIFNEFYQKVVNNEEIVCIKNQKFCITEVDDIVEGIVKALKHDMNGLFHLSSSNYLSRYDLANIFAKKIFGGYSKIIEKDYLDFAFEDKRHIYGGLCGDRLRDILKIHYMDTTEILDKYANTLI